MATARSKALKKVGLDKSIKGNPFYKVMGKDKKVDWRQTNKDRAYHQAHKD